MTLLLYVLIAWIIICVFFIISKGMTKIENIITFFCFSIVTINISTILDMNLKLTDHSNNIEMFLSFLIQRDIIIPLSLMAFVNLTICSKGRLRKFAIGVITLLAICSIEFLAVGVGIITYTGWNGYLTILLAAVLLVFSDFLARMIKKL